MDRRIKAGEEERRRVGTMAIEVLVLTGVLRDGRLAVDVDEIIQAPLQTGIGVEVIGLDAAVGAMVSGKVTCRRRHTSPSSFQGSIS